MNVEQKKYLDCGIATHSGFNLGLPEEDPRRNNYFETLKHANTHKFLAVQLYINQKFINDNYQKKLLKRINNCNIKNLLFHLPDKSSSFFEESVYSLVKFIEQLNANIKWHAFIHFEIKEKKLVRELKYHEIPSINGKPVSIENSKTGVFDWRHVIRAARLARKLGTGFVFDIGRILYPDENGEVKRRQTLMFIKRIINLLKPGRDIIHHTAKSAWFKTFREASVAIGQSGDITKPLIDPLISFVLKGGIIVLEFEKEKQILDSRDYIVNYSLTKY